MRLYLIRHGETEYNAIQRMQGWDEIPLNDAGIAQASRLGVRLKDFPIDHVYSSDLRRTVMTSAVVAAHTGLPITWEPLFRERNPGDLTGQHYTTCPEFFSDDTFEPPNGESVSMFAGRVREAMAWLIAREGDSDRHIAVVTHGMFCTFFVRECLGFDPLEDSAFHWPNTALTIADYKDGTWTHELLACGAHLDEIPDHRNATGA